MGHIISGVTEWMTGWKKRNWMLSSGGPVKNKEDFLELDEAMQGISLKWVCNCDSGHSHD